MLNAINSKVLDKKIDTIIKEAVDDKLDPYSESTKTRYDKSEILGAVKKLVNDNKENEELRKKLNSIGDKKMDDKDAKLLGSELEKMFNIRLEKMEEGINKKFGTLENELNGVKTKSDEVCKDGKCFTKKLDDVNDVLSKITEVLSKNKTSEEISSVKTDVESQISKITEDIAGISSKINNDMLGLTSKIGEACTGIDCIKKRFDTEDDMVECPACENVFSLSANTIGNTIVCPNCRNILELE